MDRKVYSTMQAIEDTHWWFVSRRLIVNKILKSLAFIGSDSKVLEIGCGSGGNLKMLNQHGKLNAVELDDGARRAANEKNICEVLKGSLPDEIPFSETFDVICMFDVLEHIKDDEESLQAIRSLLKDNGKFILTVPAYNFLWGPHDVLHHHYRRYTKGGLVGLLKDHGFRVEFSSYFNTFLFPIISVARLIEKLFCRRDIADMKPPCSICNFFLKKIFSSEALFLPKMRFPFGVSILVVAQLQKID